MGYRTHHCGELNIKDTGKQVKLAGWIAKNRDFGALTFIDLRDRYGITQLAFNAQFNQELLSQARNLGREYVVQVSGIVKERENKNLKNPTGEIEIEVFSILLLNKAKLPPFTIEDETDGGEELRMQYR